MASPQVARSSFPFRRIMGYFSLSGCCRDFQLWSIRYLDIKDSPRDARIKALGTQSSPVYPVCCSSTNTDHFSILDTNIATAAIATKSISVLFLGKIGRTQPAHHTCRLNPCLWLLGGVLINSIGPHMLERFPLTPNVFNRVSCRHSHDSQRSRRSKCSPLRRMRQTLYRR